MADHESRIPKPGDYFVFEYGRGEQRHHPARQGRSGEGVPQRLPPPRVAAVSTRVRRGSSDRGAAECQTGRRAISRSSNWRRAATRRCSAARITRGRTTWAASLVSFPTGMPATFDAAEHGLHPAHVRTVEGFIYVSLTQQQPPDFDTFVASWRAVCEEYRDEGPQDRDAAPGADQGELEARGRELPRVLSLPAVAHQILLGRAPAVRRWIDGRRRATRPHRTGAGTPRTCTEHGGPGLRTPHAADSRARPRWSSRQRPAAWAWAEDRDAISCSATSPGSLDGKAARPAPAEAKRVDAHVAVGDDRIFDGVYPGV